MRPIFPVEFQLKGPSGFRQQGAHNCIECSFKKVRYLLVPLYTVQLTKQGVDVSQRREVKVWFTEESFRIRGSLTTTA